MIEIGDIVRIKSNDVLCKVLEIKIVTVNVPSYLSEIEDMHGRTIMTKLYVFEDLKSGHVFQRIFEGYNNYAVTRVEKGIEVGVRAGIL